MKKTQLLLLGFLIFTIHLANAQDKPNAKSKPSAQDTTQIRCKYSLSFIASPQISWLTPSSSLIQSDAASVGFAGGVITDYYFQKHRRYSIHSGFVISQVGGNLKYVVNDTIVNSTSGKMEVVPAKTKAHYRQTNIEIPITLKLRTAQFKRNIYYVQFGLVNRIKVGEQVDFDYEYRNQINQKTKSFTVGGNFGAGLEYDVGRENYFILGVTYHCGLSDFSVDDVVSDDTKINTVRLQLGLVF